MGELANLLGEIGVTLIGIGLMLSAFGIGKRLISAAAVLIVLALCGDMILGAAVGSLTIFTEWLLKIVLAAIGLFVIYKLVKWLLSHI